MKKNVMMRVASALGVAVLLTTCVISGTFAKYTTTTSGGDSARVAKWGFSAPASVTINNLFNYSDGGVLAGTDGKVDGLIAPGTTNTVTFGFVYDGANGEETIAAPEVDYTFVVTVDSTCDELIKGNSNIKWYLDGTAQASFDALVTAIAGLDGNVEANGDVPANKYEAGTLPEAFYTDHADGIHEIKWEWLIGSTAEENTTDTNMGNAATLDDVSITITITVTQVD